MEYQRTLTKEETALMGADPERYEEWQITDRTAQRDIWFAALSRNNAGEPAEVA